MTFAHDKSITIFAVRIGGIVVAGVAVAYFLVSPRIDEIAIRIYEVAGCDRNAVTTNIFVGTFMNSVLMALSGRIVFSELIPAKFVADTNPGLTYCQASASVGRDIDDAVSRSGAI